MTWIQATRIWESIKFLRQREERNEKIIIVGCTGNSQDKMIKYIQKRKKQLLHLVMLLYPIGGEWQNQATHASDDKGCWDFVPLKGTRVIFTWKIYQLDYNEYVKSNGTEEERE